MLKNYYQKLNHLSNENDIQDCFLNIKSMKNKLINNHSFLTEEDECPVFHNLITESAEPVANKSSSINVTFLTFFRW